MENTSLSNQNCDNFQNAVIDLMVRQLQRLDDIYDAISSGPSRSSSTVNEQDAAISMLTIHGANFAAIARELGNMGIDVHPTTLRRSKRFTRFRQKVDEYFPAKNGTKDDEGNIEAWE